MIISNFSSNKNNVQLLERAYLGEFWAFLGFVKQFEVFDDFRAFVKAFKIMKIWWSFSVNKSIENFFIFFEHSETILHFFDIWELWKFSNFEKLLKNIQSI